MSANQLGERTHLAHFHIQVQFVFLGGIDREENVVERTELIAKDDVGTR